MDATQTIQAETDSYEAKRARLQAHLQELGRLAIAFSGGVDSSALLAIAHQALGTDAIAVLADSPSLPRRELYEAQETAESLGVELVVVATTEGDDPSYQANLGNRCYFCKAALFRAMETVCRDRGVPWMAFGEITDDWSDHRPGAQAAKEFGVVAPLSQAGMDKADVRRLAAEFGLSAAEKPASACLASRIPVGTVVTPERLATVEAAEDSLRELPFGVLRVRHHGVRARVEVGREELLKALELRPEIERRLTRVGFESVEIAEYGTK